MVAVVAYVTGGVLRRQQAFAESHDGEEEDGY